MSDAPVSEPKQLNDPDRVSIDTGHMIDFLAAKATEEVDLRVLRREEQRRASMRWISSVIGLVGIGGIAGSLLIAYNFLRNQQEMSLKSNIERTVELPEFRADLSTTVEQTVRKAVDSKLKSIKKQLDSVFAYQKFLVVTTNIDLNKSISMQDVDTTLSLLEEIKRSGLHEQDDFPNHLAKVINSLTSVSRSRSAVDRIDDLFRPIINGMRQGVTTWMADYYGRKILASNTVVKQESDLWKRFRVYADLSTQNGDPEHPLFFEILFFFRNEDEKKSNTVTKLLERVSVLDDDDKQEFFGMMRIYNGSMSDSSGELQYIKLLVQKFTELYEDELVKLGYRINES